MTDHIRDTTKRTERIDLDWVRAEALRARQCLSSRVGELGLVAMKSIRADQLLEKTLPAVITELEATRAQLREGRERPYGDYKRLTLTCEQYIRDLSEAKERAADYEKEWKLSMHSLAQTDAENKRLQDELTASQRLCEGLRAVAGNEGDKHLRLAQEAGQLRAQLREAEERDAEMALSNAHAVLDGLGIHREDQDGPLSVPVRLALLGARAEAAEAALVEANALIAQYKQDFSQMNREWSQAEEALAAERERGRVLRVAAVRVVNIAVKDHDSHSTAPMMLVPKQSIDTLAVAALQPAPAPPDAKERALPTRAELRGSDPDMVTSQGLREERIRELEQLLEDWRECWVRNGGFAYHDLVDRTRDLLSGKSKEFRHQWWCRGQERCTCTDSWKAEEKARVAALSTSSEPEVRDA
jgi:hypothetical protein